MSVQEIRRIFQDTLNEKIEKKKEDYFCYFRTFSAIRDCKVPCLFLTDQVNCSCVSAII